MRLNSILSIKKIGALCRCELLGAFAMALFCLALATAFFFNGRHIDLYSIAGSASFLSFLAVAFSRSGRQLPLGPAGLLLLAFVIWNAVALVWSYVPYISSVKLGMLGSALAVYITWRLYNADGRPFPTTFLLLGLGFAFTVTMLGQTAAGIRPHAMLLNPNSAAGFLNFLWPAAAVGWLNHEDSPIRRYGYLAAVFFMVFALAIDGSRGALIGSLTGLTIIVLVGLALIGTRRSTAMLIGTFLVALLSANAVGTGGLTSSAITMTDPGLAGASRFTIWSAAWEMIQDHPWLGYGPGVFWLAYRAYRHTSDGSGGYFVHNDYMEWWIDSGLPGLLLALGIGIACAWLFMKTIRNYRQNGTDRSRIHLATICFAGSAGVAAHSLFSFNFQMMPFLLLLAILIAELERSANVAPIARIPLLARPQRVLPVISLLALLLIPLGHFARTSAAFAYVSEGSEQLARGSYALAAKEFTTARGIWSDLDAPWYMHAEALLKAMRENDAIADTRQRALVTRAADLLDEAEERNPLRPHTPLIRGLLQADHPEMVDGEAEKSLRRSVELDPRNIEARYALSQVIARKGRTGEALRLIEEGLTINFADHVNTTPLRKREVLLRQRLEEGESIDAFTPGDPPALQNERRFH